ncbi:MAG: hypothetical protein J6X58_03065 [Bacteroidales bacterium]|nr:hypothetical protein [Bacteroidales bacterium]
MAIDEKTLNQLESSLLRTRRLKAEIERKLEYGDLNRDILMALLLRNPNIIDPDTARYLLNKKILSKDDFNDCNIDFNFVDLLLEEEPTDPADASEFVPIQSIAPGSTEVYFWGMPAAGKSCALGALLSIANNGDDTMMQQQCQGGSYMSHLAEIFHHDGAYGYLPAGTAIMNTYEMRFSLIRDEKEHPLSLIDLSGELFKCLYKKFKNNVLNDDEQTAFDTLNNLLVEHASENRKLHFFVIEYGAQDKKIDGLRQDEYLKCAAEYLNQLGVFREYSDAIYIVLTKADKAGNFDNRQDEDDHYYNYMSQNYRSFYSSLRKMCKDNSINGGQLQFVPFTIGDIVLRRMCRFNATSAREILDYIVERSAYVERNKLGRIVRILRQ